MLDHCALLECQPRRFPDFFHILGFKCNHPTLDGDWFLTSDIPWDVWIRIKKHEFPRKEIQEGHFWGCDCHVVMFPCYFFFLPLWFWEDFQSFCFTNPSIWPNHNILPITNIGFPETRGCPFWGDLDPSIRNPFFFFPLAPGVPTTPWTPIRICSACRFAKHWFSTVHNSSPVGTMEL